MSVYISDWFGTQNGMKYPKLISIGRENWDITPLRWESIDAKLLYCKDV